MSEINQREEELGKIRAQLMSNQDELKLLTVSREQLRQQKEVLAVQFRDRDSENERLKKKVEELTRLCDSMCMAQRNNSDLPQHEVLDKARDEIERADRIARSTNKSSFMHLGEKQPNLVSEVPHQLLGPRSINDDPYRANQLDDTYLRDDTIPAEIYTLIQAYR